MNTEIEAIAAAMRRQFRGAGVRIGRSAVVHAAEDCTWIGGAKVPGPACHTGFALDITRLTPARGEVTCGRCLQRRTSSAAPQLVPGQLSLLPTRHSAA